MTGSETGFGDNVSTLRLGKCWPTALALGLSLLLLTACDSNEEPPPPPTDTIEPISAAPDPALSQATEQTWALGTDYLENSVARVTELADATEQLLANPDSERLTLARQAWQRSHQAYQPMAVLLSAGTSNPGLFGRLQQRDFYLDAWPIQPGFIDYYGVYTHSGIVNDIAMPLTADALREQHGITDESDVSLGFHALEYLLWGEQGERPPSDFTKVSALNQAQKAAGLRVVDLPNNRRRTLLELLIALLDDDIRNLQQDWNGPGGVHQYYTQLPPLSRAELWQDALAQWATANRSRLQSLIDNSANDNQNDDELLGVHNPFAADNAQTLGWQLNGVLALLEIMGEHWQTAETLPASLEQTRQVRDALLNWEGNWPPDSTQAQALIGLLEGFGQ